MEIKNADYVSIIMAAYNAEKTIASSIESVLRQTYRNFELLIIDDCSTDNTLDIIAQYNDCRIRVFTHSRNMGVSHTRHQGILEAKGDWIAILDSDDLWAYDKLEKQFKRQKETNGEFFFTASSFILNDKLKNWILEVPETIEYKALLKQNRISNSSVLIRKKLYQQYEVVKEGIIHEDFACWLNVLKSGIVAYGINEPLLIYRISSNSKSGNKWKALLMNWNTYRVIGLNYCLSAYYMLWYIYNGVIKYKNIMK